MAKDGTNRGGNRPGAGRKPKAISEKIANGNPGGRKLEAMDFGNQTECFDGIEMPQVSDYMTSVQKDGTEICAEEIFKKTWNWLHERKCDHLIPTQQLEHYAMAVARWIQCEEAISKYGFLSKKPTGTVTSSPFVNMGKEYMRQANTAWYAIYQVVKENCMTGITGYTPQDDAMERLLRARENHKF